MSYVPVVVVASLDPVLRETLTASLLLDVPGAVAVRHDLDGRSGTLDRTVSDAHGVRERARLELDHSCLSCALRQDVLPAVERALAAPVTPAAVVLALPVASEPLPVVTGLQHLARRADLRVRPAVAGVATVADGAGLVHDLLGDDLLAERGLHLAEDDRRAVGETLVHQLEVSDALVVDGPLDDVATTLAAHLAPAARPEPLHAVDAARLLLAARGDDDPRGDLRRVRPGGVPDAHGVGTVDLATWRPLHPDRLREGLHVLGTGPLRGRGTFWLPTRPDVVAGWDGGGGQLSIGTLGCWGLTPPRTRLVVTGLGHDPDLLRAAFDRAALTDAELARGLDRWAGRDDGFDPWLGDTRMSA